MKCQLYEHIIRMKKTHLNISAEYQYCEETKYAFTTAFDQKLVAMKNN